MCNNQNKNNQNKVEEYKELGNNIRHYSTVTLTLFSIYITITSALLYALANLELQDTEKFVLSLSAFFCTIAFLLQQLSASFLWGKYVRKAKKIEQSIDYSIYSNLPLRFRIATWSIYFIFLFFSILWIAKMADIFEQGKVSISLVENWDSISHLIEHLWHEIGELLKHIKK